MEPESTLKALEDYTRLPVRESLMLVSGRASFELIRKAVAAAFQAISTAERCGMTLIGFLREGRFGAGRIVAAENAQ